MTQQQPTAAEQMRTAYEKSEKQLSKAAEDLVSSQGFADMLAMVTSNTVALSRVVTIGLDQAVRATRLAGQKDIVRLGKQLARTEDKLEQVLQVVEQLEDELARTRAERDEARREVQPVQARAKRTSAARTSTAKKSANGAGGAAKKTAGTNSRTRSASVTGEESAQ